MNDVQIEYFLAVADNLNFTKAAEEKFISQPAISKQISAMEKELGFALFRRTNKSITLTATGKLLYNFYKQYKRDLNNVLSEARSLNEKQSGHVRFACLEGWNVSNFMPEVLATFSKTFPNVKVTLESRGFKGLLNALKSDKVDLIMTIDVTLHESINLEVEKLTTLPSMILFSSRHPLFMREDVKPEDFKNEDFLVLSSNEYSYAINMVNDFCAPYGFVPNIQYVPNIESMLLSVQNGLGVAITDNWSRTKSSEGFRHIMLKGQHTISLAWSKNNKNAAVRLLVDELVAWFSESKELLP